MSKEIGNIRLSRGRSNTNNRNLHRATAHGQVYGHIVGQSKSGKLIPTHRQIVGHPLKYINTECNAKAKFTDPFKSFQLLEKQHNSKLPAYAIQCPRYKQVKNSNELPHYLSNDGTEGYQIQHPSHHAFGHQLQKSRYLLHHYYQHNYNHHHHHPCQHRQHLHNQHYVVKEHLGNKPSKALLINTLHDLRLKHLKLNAKEAASWKGSAKVLQQSQHQQCNHNKKFFEILNVTNKYTKSLIKPKSSISNLYRQTGGYIDYKNVNDKTRSDSSTSSSDMMKNNQSEHMDKAHKLRMDYLRLINVLKSGKKPTDSEVVFGNACYYFPGRRYGWEKSRIEWLQRLECQSYSRTLLGKESKKHLSRSDPMGDLKTNTSGIKSFCCYPIAK